MNEDLINKLQFYGYKVTNKGLVQKYSQSTRRTDVAGQLNNAGVWFYAQNVSPFKPGQNTFKDILGENQQFIYTPYTPEPTIQKSFTFDDYIKTTQSKNQFSIYLNQLSKDYLSKGLNNTQYDIRGVKDGNFKDAVLFPYINFYDEFQTAKIVKYNSNTGKRLKENYSNSWFHSEKTIKTQLGIKDKISKSINCFFGENLLSNNSKPVVIVEAEKTAIILSLFYKNIVFIATGGVAKLKGLEWNFLTNRQVFLFPDNNAVEWFDIANERGWWVSDILENKGEPGTDVVDYLTTYRTNENNASVWWELQEQLFNIDAGETENIECTSLNFEHKKELSFNYCLPTPKDANILYYWDNAKGSAFTGKHFQIFKDDFQVLNANVDFNKTHKNEFGWQQMDVNKFLTQLEKTFRIIKHLNSDKNYLKLFSKVLYNLIENSNHRFNISYIERAILPFWDGGENNIQKYIKFRNWRFASIEKVGKKEFVSFLNNDKKLFSTNQYLIKLLPLLEKKEFILPEYIGLHQKSINPFIDDLIKEYNKNVLGCATMRNYQSKLKVSEYLNWWAANINKLDVNAKLYFKLCSTYNNTYIGCKEKDTIYKIPSILAISENTGVIRRLINEYFNFKPDAFILTYIKEKVNYYISNPQEFNFNRSNKYIEVIPNKMEIKAAAVVVMSNADAFNYELDLTNSVLNISEAKARTRDVHFLASWILFHNPKLTEEERENVKYCPSLFFKPKKAELLYA